MGKMPGVVRGTRTTAGETRHPTREPQPAFRRTSTTMNPAAEFRQLALQQQTRRVFLGGAGRMCFPQMAKLQAGGVSHRLEFGHLTGVWL